MSGISTINGNFQKLFWTITRGYPRQKLTGSLEITQQCKTLLLWDLSGCLISLDGTQNLWKPLASLCIQETLTQDITQISARKMCAPSNQHKPHTQFLFAVLSFPFFQTSNAGCAPSVSWGRFAKKSRRRTTAADNFSSVLFNPLKSWWFRKSLARVPFLVRSEVMEVPQSGCFILEKTYDLEVYQFKEIPEF